MEVCVSITSSGVMGFINTETSAYATTELFIYLCIFVISRLVNF
jgi:hypothetical protein